VLQSAPVYQQTASQLLAIRDTPFPSESVSAEIANSVPEVVKLLFAIAEREGEIAELARRSVRVLEGWYELVEGFNGCVAEWDERLREVERTIVRREKVEGEDDEY
jgi:hypothetical protein